jgi:xanthine/uracil permease
MTQAVHPVDARLPTGKLAALGLQHVLVMYAGAIAVPLIVGRALKLSPEQVAMLISADLFCCGIVTLIQSLGATQWFGIKLPVMMGVTFASVAPMVAIAGTNPGVAGAQLIFGAIIGAGVVSMLLAPAVSRMLRFFPPVVTGTIITVIGISLMRIGINWIFGNPFGPTAPSIVNPEHAQWLASVSALGAAAPALPKGLALVESLPTVVLGGAGLVMFGMVTATGIRILVNVDFKTNKHNSFIVAVTIGMGMIPLIAPSFKQWMPHGLHPLIESGILLAAISAVLLNLFFNDARGDSTAAVQAAKQADAH